MKGKDLRISEDYTKEIAAQRKSLAPYMFEARHHGKKAFLSGERLIVDKNTYTVQTVHKLSDVLDMSKAGTKTITEDITGFYRSLSFLSNFRFSAFMDRDGIQFHSSAQYLHHRKAIIINDLTIAENILCECKILGNPVQIFVNDRWRRNAKYIMIEGLWFKFSQNKHCLKALESTGTCKLVEASPYDNIWGVGLGLDSEDLKNPNKWKGVNMMGSALQEIRIEMIN